MSGVFIRSSQIISAISSSLITDIFEIVTRKIVSSINVRESLENSMVIIQNHGVF